jgi:hypothetical protein
MSPEPIDFSKYEEKPEPQIDFSKYETAPEKDGFVRTVYGDVGAAAEGLKNLAGNTATYVGHQFNLSDQEKAANQARVNASEANKQQVYSDFKKNFHAGNYAKAASGLGNLFSSSSSDDPNDPLGQVIDAQIKSSGQAKDRMLAAAKKGDALGVAQHAAGIVPIASQVDDAMSRYQSDPSRENLAHVVTAAIPAFVPSLIRGAGKVPASVTDAVSNTAQAATDAVKSGALTIAEKTPILKSLIDGPATDLLTRAIKPAKNNTGWARDLNTALPNMKAAESAIGHPVQNIDDAAQAASIAKKQLWQQYEQRLGPAAKMGAIVDGNQIANSIERSVSKRTALQNPALAERIQKVADTYRRDIPVQEAEDFLQNANDELHSYYAKNKVGQSIAASDPETSSTLAEAQSLRKVLYGKLDQISGPGAFDLKRQYGALTNVENELVGRKNIAARAQPQNLNEQFQMARGAGKIAKGVVTMDAGDVLEGSRSIAVSHWLKERFSSDAMITRAFEKAQPLAEIIGPPKPLRIVGLLGRGARPMPASPFNAGGATPSVELQAQPQFYAPQSVRRGHLLPSGPRMMPSEMEPIGAPSRPTKVINRNPKTGKMQVQYYLHGRSD